jgi:hypothetical protein
VVLGRRFVFGSLNPHVALLTGGVPSHTHTQGCALRLVLGPPPEGPDAPTDSIRQALESCDTLVVGIHVVLGASAQMALRFEGVLERYRCRSNPAACRVPGHAPIAGGVLRPACTGVAEWRDSFVSTEAERTHPRHPGASRWTQTRRQRRCGRTAEKFSEEPRGSLTRRCP